MCDAFTKVFPVLVEYRKQNVTHIPGIPAIPDASKPQIPSGSGIVGQVKSNEAHELLSEEV